MITNNLKKYMMECVKGSVDASEISVSAPGIYYTTADGDSTNTAWCFMPRLESQTRICVGESDTPATEDDYNLGDRIAASDVSVSAPVKNLFFGDGTTEMLYTVQISLVDVSKEIRVNEIGIFFRKYQNQSDNSDIMMAREVLDEPIVLNAQNLSASVSIKVSLI